MEDPDAHGTAGPIGRRPIVSWPDKPPGLAALEGRRRWDLVLDTWSRAPKPVESSATLLRDRADRYFYVSSIAVYRGFKELHQTEDAAVWAPALSRASDESLPYPVAKSTAEHYVRQAFGDRAGIFRCSSIFGYDRWGLPDNQQLYWALRLRQGGRVLAPGDGSAPLQYVDVRDLARFVIDGAEQSLGGTWNPLGPAARFTFRDFLEGLN